MGSPISVMGPPWSGAGAALRAGPQGSVGDELFAACRLGLVPLGAAAAGDGGARGLDLAVVAEAGEVLDDAAEVLLLDVEWEEGRLEAGDDHALDVAQRHPELR